MMPARFHEADYVEALLIDWASWMRMGQYTRGFPRSVPGLSNGGASQQFDHMVEDNDINTATKTNAIIRDLPPVEQCALEIAYLFVSVYRFPREEYADILARAKANLALGLKRRGIWVGEGQDTE